MKQNNNNKNDFSNIVYFTSANLFLVLVLVLNCTPFKPSSGSIHDCCYVSCQCLYTSVDVFGSIFSCRSSNL